jgi:hypothetical protein
MAKILVLNVHKFCQRKKSEIELIMVIFENEGFTIKMNVHLRAHTHTLSERMTNVNIINIELRNYGEIV